jgi:hypothetical protein
MKNLLQFLKGQKLVRRNFLQISNLKPLRQELLLE